MKKLRFKRSNFPRLLGTQPAQLSRHKANLDPREGNLWLPSSVLSQTSGSLHPWGKEDWSVPSFWTLGFLEILQPASGADRWAFGAVLSGEGLEIAHGLLENLYIFITHVAPFLCNILASGKASLAWQSLLKCDQVGEKKRYQKRKEKKKKGGEIKWSAFI